MPFRPPHRPLIVRLLLWLWVAPLTLFGLTLAIPVCVVRGRCRVLRGQAEAILIQGALADWALPRHPAGSMHAITLGHVIIAISAPMPARLIAHELEHVRQAERWGPLFPLLYIGSSAWQWLCGRNAYRDNHFEVAARAVEKSAARETA